MSVETRFQALVTSGDAEQSLLTLLDFLLSDGNEAMRAAIEVAAIPRTFDTLLLGRLLEIDQERARVLVATLERLPPVTRATGQDAYQIRCSVRDALRRRLARNEPDRFWRLTSRAAAHFLDGSTEHHVERLYHELSVPNSGAALALTELANGWYYAGRHEELHVLGRMLGELLAATTLPPDARTEVLLVYLWINANHLSLESLEPFAREALALATTSNDERRIARARQRLGRILQSRGHERESDAEFERAKTAWLSIAEATPSDVEAQHETANAYRSDAGRASDERDFGNSRRFYEMALGVERHLMDRDDAIGRSTLGVALTLAEFSRLLAKQGEEEQAVAKAAEALSLVEGLVATDVTNSTWAEHLCRRGIDMGNAFTSAGRHNEAVEQYNAARKVASLLTELDGSNAAWLDCFASATDCLAASWKKQERLEVAIQAQLEVATVYRRLVGVDASNITWQISLSDSYRDLGDLSSENGDAAGALVWRTNALVVLEQISGSTQPRRRLTERLSDAHVAVADSQREQRLFSAALAHLDQAASLARTAGALGARKAAMLRQLSNARRGSAIALSWQGRHGEAVAACEAALSLDNEIASLEPDEPGWQRRLVGGYTTFAYILRDADRLEESLQQFATAGSILSTLPKDSHSSDFHAERRALGLKLSVGEVLLVQGKGSEALAEFTAAGELAASHAALEPGVQFWTEQHCRALCDVGDAFVKLGKAADGVASYRAALALTEERHTSVGPEPKAKRWQDYWGYRVRIDLDRALMQEGHYDEALAECDAVLALEERQPWQTRSDPARQHRMSVGLVERGHALMKLGRVADAIAAYRRALPFSSAWLAAESNSASRKRGAANCHFFLARALRDAGEQEDALREYEHSQRLLDEVTTDEKETAEAWRSLGVVHTDVASLLWRMGRQDEAIDRCEQALRTSQDLVKKAPDEVSTQHALAVNYINLAHLRRQGPNHPALVNYYEALRILREIRAGTPHTSYLLMYCHYDIGVELEENNVDWALSEYRTALEIGRGLLDIDPRNTMWLELNASCHSALARVRTVQGDVSEAEREKGAAIALRSRIRTTGESSYSRDGGNSPGNTEPTVFGVVDLGSHSSLASSGRNLN